MHSINEIKKIPVIFIIGKGRSGTSLLQAVFNANPNAVTANESAFIIYLKQKYSAVKEWNTVMIHEFISDLYKDKKFALLWNIDPLVLKDKIHSFPPEQLSFSVLCKIVYLETPSPFPKEDCRVIIDKNPLYSFFIKELLEIFPEAKFIHLIRDYRDNIISTRKAFKIYDISVIAQRWKKQNKLIDLFKKRFNERFFTIQYEKLVSEPNKYVKDICTFAGISFNPGMLNFHKTTEKIYSKEFSVNSVMTEIVQDMHLNLLKPINTERIDKWKLELSKSEIELIDYITGEYASTYGYMRTTRVIKPRFILHSIKSNFRYLLNYILYKIYFRFPITLRENSRKFFQKWRTKLGFKKRHIGMEIKNRD